MPLASWVALSLALCLLTNGLSFKSEDVHVDFDDRNGSPSAFTINHVGTQGGLMWEGFSIDRSRADPKSQDFSGVEAHSEPNYAGAELGGLLAPPSVSSQFFGSDVAFFDLERFFWGCATLDPDSRQLPEWCKLDVRGYTAGNSEPVAQTTSFFSPEPDQQSMPMVETILPPSFDAVSRVEFLVDGKSPILYVDDVSWRLYKVTAMGTGLSEIHHAHDESSQSEFHMQVMGGDRLRAVLL